MCTNYRPTAREAFAQAFEPIRQTRDLPNWSQEVYRDGQAPIIVPDDEGGRLAVIASYGFVPKRHIKGKDFDTMNARGEEIHRKPTYREQWKQCQLCLIPAQAVYEPFWENRVHQRFAIGMADGSDFCVAGIWREWQEADGAITHAFTQITLNADEHPLMNLFHQPFEEKRGVVILPREAYDDWLVCKNAEDARALLKLMPAQKLRKWAAPKPKAPSPQMTLF